MLPQGWASGRGLQEHWKQSDRGENTEGVEVQLLFVSTEGRGKVKRPLTILWVKSFDGQKRAGGMEGRTSDSCIIDRS